MISFQPDTIANAVEDGVILMDARGHVTMFNRACERVFGYAAEEIVGADLQRLMQTPHQNGSGQTLLDPQRTVVQEILGARRQVSGLRKSGEIFPMDLSVREVDGGREVAYIAILRDASERLRAEESREHLIAQLRKTNADLTHFVHAASHDLREPMRTISAFGARLAKDYGDRLDARGAEYLSLVLSASERMHRLLDDLMDFAHLSNTVERGSRFDANILVDRVVDNLTKCAERSDVEITHGELPHITADPSRFERLMHNLIGNACKYVAPNVRPAIRIDAAREGEFWRFSVSDNGIGINPRYFDQIFQPFKRLHSDGRYEGAGLGLAICRKIVESFGGILSVRSSEGQGSTFSFTIPADAQADGGVSDGA